MIDEKKLIENILCGDGINFKMEFDVTSPESVCESLQEFADRIKGIIIRIIEAQPKIFSGVDLAQRETAWIPVVERFPEPFEIVYVYDRTKDRITDAYLTRHMEWVGVCMNHEVTHWMPIPKPPKDGEAR